MAKVEKQESERPPHEEPIQFGLVPLFFLTAFVGALLMVAMAATTPLNNVEAVTQAAAARGRRVVAYAGLSSVLAVLTVLSMVKKAKPRNSTEVENTRQPNSLAPGDYKH